jgi:hypothetical protein
MRKRLTHCFVLAAESNNGQTLRGSPIKYAKDRIGRVFRDQAPEGFAYLGLGVFEFISSNLHIGLEGVFIDSVRAQRNYSPIGKLRSPTRGNEVLSSTLILSSEVTRCFIMLSA